ncbi:MAG: cell division protein FtsQ/DivIB [Paracoccaceae bacterium]|nr:cell division protein FtsQ/DivIB [Paracoccaceae bacterium]
MRPLNSFARRPAALRRDPAPSRIAYRLNRLWLTPLFRALLRVGLPALVVAVAAGVYLADDARRSAVGENLTALRAQIKNRPEFLITLLSIEGASPDVGDAVRRALALSLPQSSLDIDLEAARGRVETIDAVAGAQIRVRDGGVLQVQITEREPAVVWRQPDGLYLLDKSGKRVAEIYERADRADLPLIAGQGADLAVPEALQILLSAGPLLPRLRGLVRMGERRWDIVLDRDQRLLLPVEQPVRALERLIALDQAQDLLARDVLAVDLRSQNRPALRLAPYALVEMRRLRGILPTESDL